MPLIINRRAAARATADTVFDSDEDGRCRTFSTLNKLVYDTLQNSLQPIVILVLSSGARCFLVNLNVSFLYVYKPGQKSYRYKVELFLALTELLKMKYYIAFSYSAGSSESNPFPLKH